MKRWLAIKLEIEGQQSEEDSEFTRYLLQGSCGEDVVIVKTERFAKLLAQIDQLLQTLLNHLLPLGDVLGNRSFVFPDAGRTLSLIELHLEVTKTDLPFLFSM